jgi:hypothetical protein
MRSRTQQPRDALGAPAALDEDDRSPEQQLADLGVEVVKPITKWYKPMTQRRGKVGLKDKISLTKSGFTFGVAAAEEIGAGSLLNFAVYERSGRRYIAIQKSNKDGLKMHKTKNNSYRVSSEALARFFVGENMPLGKYRLEKIKGGWLAVPEGGR